MISFFDDAQRAHDPKFFFSPGSPQVCSEKLTRIDALLEAVRGLGGPAVTPLGAGPEPIGAVHSSRFLTFREGINDRRRRIEGASAEVISGIHPANRLDGYPKSAVGQADYHQTAVLGLLRETPGSLPTFALSWAATYKPFCQFGEATDAG